MRKITGRTFFTIMLQLALLMSVSATEMTISAFKIKDRRIGSASVNPVNLIHAPVVQDPDSKIRQFSVERYGANPLDSVDDTAAILAANKALQADGGGELIFSPTAGEYKISKAIPIKSGTTVRCGVGAHPLTPFADKEQPDGPCTIRLTSANNSIFLIGGHVVGVKFEGLSMIADSKTGTSAIKLFGQKPYSSFNFEFANLAIKDFDKGIYILDNSGGTAETIHWQIDNVLVKRCDFHENNYGIWSNTANATNWLIMSIKFDIAPKGYGVWLAEGALWNFVDVQFISDKTNTAQAGLYLGVSPGYIKLDNCVFEGPVLALDTQDTPVSNSSAPILFQNSFLYGIRLRHSRNLVFVANTWGGPNQVTNTANAGDIQIWSFGDSIRGPGASINAAPGTAFGLLTGGGLCITEFNSYNNRICTSQARGLTTSGNLGIGNTTTAQTASGRSIFNIGRTGAQESNNITSIQLNGSNASINYNWLRNATTGDLMNLGTQAGYTGFWFNGAVKTNGVNYLAVSGVTDAVTNSTATVTSATANFTTAMVGAQVILSDDTHTHVTTIAARNSAMSVTLAAAPAWTATNVRMMIAYDTGVNERVGAGAPSLPCAPGSEYHRTDGGASASLYICFDNGGGVGAWVAK